MISTSCLKLMSLSCLRKKCRAIIAKGVKKAMVSRKTLELSRCKTERQELCKGASWRLWASQ